MAYYEPLGFRSDHVPPDRRNLRNTLIEDEPQTVLTEYLARAKLRVTPGQVYDGNQQASSKETTPSSDATSDKSSLWSKRESNSDYDDDLYNLTDDESVEVPLICSDSVKRSAAKTQSRYPSLIIPSPSHWPLPPTNPHPAHPKSATYSIGLSPASKIALSPIQLSMHVARTLRVPSSSGPPSLDGSLTSDELAASSCPSTPDSQARADNQGEWDPPIRLNAAAVDTLHQISPDREGQDAVVEHSVEISPEALQEMQEITRETPIRYSFVPAADLNVRYPTPEANDPLSALTVPSPGGFFASLNVSARQTWTGKKAPSLPSTSVAEKFYGVPWRDIPPEVPAVPKAFTTTEASSPPTSNEETEATELDTGGLTRSASYHDELKQKAGASFDRTKLWLHAQWTYFSAVADDSTTPETKSLRSPQPSTPDIGASPISINDSPSKKSVRFAEVLEDSAKPVVLQDPLFLQGFKYVASTVRSMDAYLHGQTRVEAVHVQGKSMSGQHCNQLQGKFEVKAIHRPAPARPVSTFLPEESDDEQKAIIASAERERQALEQIYPAAWSLQASSHIFGRQLTTSPALARLRSVLGCHVLDFGGQAHCDWAWHVALQYQRSTIVTVVQSADEPKATIAGPPNHRIVAASRLWQLPFPDDHFDLVSARTLHILLKQLRPSDAPTINDSDEYDLCLREILRILKPGGYLEFNVLDAELLHPGIATPAQALSVEFAFNLRAHGYDPCPTRSFMPRLRRAGFTDVKRAWMVLPAADVVPRWIDRGKIKPAPTVTAPAVANSPAAIGPVVSHFSPSSGTGSPESSSSSTSTTPRADSTGRMTASTKSPTGKAPGPGTPSRQDGMKQKEMNKTSYFPVQNTPVTDKDGAVYPPPLTGSTKDVRAMTGLVGARAWERWMQKLASEMGNDETKVSQSIARALEGAGGGAGVVGGAGTGAGVGDGESFEVGQAMGWRCLLGWARKPSA